MIDIINILLIASPFDISSVPPQMREPIEFTIARDPIEFTIAREPILFHEPE